MAFRLNRLPIRCFRPVAYSWATQVDDHQIGHGEIESAEAFRAWLAVAGHRAARHDPYCRRYI